MATPATHVWKPSTARTVILDGFVPVPRGSVAPEPLGLSWPAKDPNDILDYVFDVSPVLIGNGGDMFASLDVAISPDNPGDLVAGTVTSDGARAVVWLSGGIDGTTYAVTFSIVTISGRKIVRSVSLPVQSLSSLPVSVDGIVTNSGAPITDQNGNPIVLGS